MFPFEDLKVNFFTKNHSQWNGSILIYCHFYGDNWLGRRFLANNCPMTVLFRIQPQPCRRNLNCEFAGTTPYCYWPTNANSQTSSSFAHRLPSAQFDDYVSTIHARVVLALEIGLTLDHNQPLFHLHEQRDFYPQSEWVCKSCLLNWMHFHCAHKMNIYASDCCPIPSSDWSRFDSISRE